MMEEVKVEWCLLQPKIELHAHLNGSIRRSTLMELARVSSERGDICFAEADQTINRSGWSLPECFSIFDLIHYLATDHEIITRITREVVEDFAAENVFYLELRTTPKKNDAIGMSKRSYMDAIIKGLRTVDAVEVSFVPFDKNTENCIMAPPTSNAREEKERKRIYVRLILSIDRKETTEAAMETVQLALDMKNLGVVGVDLAGNPNIGNWRTFLPALKYAKEQGLFISLHCGEVPNPDEIRKMLEFHPHRIGHACCFEETEWDKLKSLGIPVEICLSSNVITKCVPSIDDHHFVDLYKSNHPLILCTDDSGVFSTSLSNEYYLAASTFGLNRKAVFVLAKQAIPAIFADDVVKENLKDIFNSAEKELL